MKHKCDRFFIHFVATPRSVFLPSDSFTALEKCIKKHAIAQGTQVIDTMLD